MDIHIHNILCPVDFSASGDYAFHYAVAIALRHEAAIELIHVTEVSAYSHDEAPHGKPTYEERLEARLRETAARAPSNVTVNPHLVAGVPYLEIVNRAKTWPADLIVMGTHGLTGMKHLLIGSVTEKVVRTATCPVLTVRHPDHVVEV